MFIIFTQKTASMPPELVMPDAELVSSEFYNDQTFKQIVKGQWLRLASSDMPLMTLSQYTATSGLRPGDGQNRLPEREQQYL